MFVGEQDGRGGFDAVAGKLTFEFFDEFDGLARVGGFAFDGELLRRAFEAGDARFGGWEAEPNLVEGFDGVMAGQDGGGEGGLEGLAFEGGVELRLEFGAFFVQDAEPMGLNAKPDKTA